MTSPSVQPCRHISTLTYCTPLIPAPGPPHRSADAPHSSPAVTPLFPASAPSFLGSLHPHGKHLSPPHTWDPAPTRSSPAPLLQGDKQTQGPKADCFSPPSRDRKGVPTKTGTRTLHMGHRQDCHPTQHPYNLLNLMSRSNQTKPSQCLPASLTQPAPALSSQPFPFPTPPSTFVSHTDISPLIMLCRAACAKLNPSQLPRIHIKPAAKFLNHQPFKPLWLTWLP